MKTITVLDEGISETSPAHTCGSAGQGSTLADRIIHHHPFMPRQALADFIPG